MSDNKTITVRIDVSEYELQMLVAALISASALQWLRGNVDKSNVLEGIAGKIIDCTMEKKAAP